jgi:methionyl-tRNA formyltransferase
MDDGFDTGPILAQARYRFDDDDGRDALAAKLANAAVESLATAVERLLAGDRGTPQGDGAYWPFFDDAYVWIDWARPAAEVHRQVRAWWRGLARDGTEGPLTELDGAVVRVLETRLEACDGLRRECGDGPIWIVETEPAHLPQGRPPADPSQRSTTIHADTRCS